MQAIRARRERPANRADGIRRPPLRQPEQRQAGLRFPPALAGAAVVALRRRKIAAQPVHLGLLVEGVGGRLPVDPPRHALRCTAGLVDCLGPRSAELHQLGAVNQAGPAERDELGLRRAPARERGRPFARAVHHVELAAARDRGAVDEPRRHRSQAARRHGDHRLVQQRQATRDLPLAQQQPSFEAAPERAQVGVTEAVTVRRGLGRRRARAVHVAGRGQPMDRRQPQVALLDTVRFLDETLGAREPSARTAHLPLRGQAKPQPERAARGALLIAGVDVQVIQALHERDVVVVFSDEPRRQRVELEIRRGQRRLSVRGGEAAVGLRPRLAPIGVATALDLVRFPGARHGRSVARELRPSARRACRRCASRRARHRESSTTTSPTGSAARRSTDPARP